MPHSFISTYNIRNVVRSLYGRPHLKTETTFQKASVGWKGGHCEFKAACFVTPWLAVWCKSASSPAQLDPLPTTFSRATGVRATAPIHADKSWNLSKGIPASDSAQVSTAATASA